MADDFFDKNKEALLSESSTLIKTMSTALLKLEKTPNELNLLYDIFRSAHTLKSISAMMRLDQIAALAHSIEDLLDAVRNRHMSLNQCADLLFESFDLLEASLKEIAAGRNELNAEQLCQQMQKLIGPSENNNKNVERPKELDFPIIEKLKSIEIKIDRLDLLMKISEEIFVSRIKLELLREVINNPDLTVAVDALGRHINEMQYNIMQIRLVPIGLLFNRFLRMVRDIAKQQHKEVDLIIEGGEIEVDRSLIDEIGEALAHLIRNALDHGIESPDIRNKRNKSRRATIKLTATRTNEFFIIEINDDGYGLNFKEIEAEAIKMKIISHGAGREEIVNSIFKGISTTKKITPISGRGLGLSIVKRKIESIGGNIRVQSNEGSGTHFHIQIPLTLAVIKVLFVNVGDNTYAIPINNVERLLSVSPEKIKRLINHNAILYENDDMPLIHLSQIFSVESKVMSSYPIVVIRRSEDLVGLVVDALVSTQDVLIKPLAKIVKESKYFSGSALIGSGEMVLILDVDHLFLSRRQKNEWKTSDAV